MRDQIKSFASTRQIFSTSAVNGGQENVAKYKLCILDESDALTSTAQMALRRIIEKYTTHTRFVLLCNYTHKISPALLSRCTRFRFSPLKERDIRQLVDKVIEEERVNISPEATDALVKLSKGDMRRALNVLQACHASSKFSFHPSALCIEQKLSHIFRYTPPHPRPARPRLKRHSPRPNHNPHNLRLHRYSRASRHLPNRRHTPQDL